MDGNDTAAFQTSILFLLDFHKQLYPMFFDKLAVIYETCLISLVIALLKVFYELTREIRAFKTVGQFSVFYAIFYFAFTAMFWFPFVTFQAAGTRFFVVAMLITYFTIHSTGGKHSSGNIPF